MKRLLLSFAALFGFGLFAAPANAGAPCHSVVRVVHHDVYHHREYCPPQPVRFIREYDCRPVSACPPLPTCREYCPLRWRHRR
jgi:hypothetical protein